MSTGRRARPWRRVGLDQNQNNAMRRPGRGRGLGRRRCRSVGVRRRLSSTVNMMDAGMQHACCSPCPLMSKAKSSPSCLSTIMYHPCCCRSRTPSGLMPLSLGLASLHALQAPAAHNQPSSSTRDDVSSVVTVRPDRPDAMPGWTRRTWACSISSAPRETR